MPRRKGAARAIDVEMLEESFDLVAPQGDELIRTFYENLFETAPSVQPLFTEVDMERQRQALLNMLLVLRESRDLDDIVPDLKELGARHVEYGAKPEHYPIVGEVLIGAMAGVAGDAWKPEYTSSWQEAYQVVQDVRLSGAAARAE